MNHRLLSRLALGATVVLTACGGSVEAKEASFDRVLVMPFDSVFRRVSEVVLRTAPNDPIGMAIGLVVTPSQIVIADPKQGNLKVFDRSGKLIRSIGRAGDGPGEFRLPAAVEIDDQGHYVVLDQRRSILSTWDTAGKLQSEHLLTGRWTSLIPVAGTGKFLVAGAGMAAPGSDALKTDTVQVLHEIDGEGRITASFHPFVWPEDNMQASFSTFFATALGRTAVSGSFRSNVVRFDDRLTGRSWEARIGAPWYTSPKWLTHEPAADKALETIRAWVREQTLLVRLLPLNTQQFIAQFRSYDPTGEELYGYVVADTSGRSRIATAPAPVMIVRAMGDTVYSVVTDDKGVVTLETRVLTNARRIQ